MPSRPSDAELRPLPNHLSSNLPSPNRPSPNCSVAEMSCRLNALSPSSATVCRRNGVVESVSPKQLRRTVLDQISWLKMLLFSDSDSYWFINMANYIVRNVYEGNFSDQSVNGKPHFVLIDPECCRVSSAFPFK